MPEVEKLGWARILQVVVPTVGVGIGLVSLLITIAAKKKELSCIYLGSEKVVSVELGGVHQEVKVQFQGRPIKPLFKMNFVLRNTGSAAIKAEDVKEPIGLYFAPGVNILNSFVERTNPAEFTFRTRDFAEQRQIFCDFSLLNSGDEAFFSVYIYDSEPQQPQLKGRIVDVKRMLNLNGSQAKAPDPFPYTSSRGVRRTLYWSLLIANGSLCITFLVGLVAVSVNYGRHLRWKRKWKTAYDQGVREIKTLPETKRQELARQIREKEPNYYVPGWIYKDLGFYESYATIAKLDKEGIPRPPRSDITSLKEYLGPAFVIVAFFMLFGLTTVFIYSSPRGF